MLKMDSLLDAKQIDHVPIRPPLECRVLPVRRDRARKNGEQVVGGHPSNRAPCGVERFVVGHHPQQRPLRLRQVVGVVEMPVPTGAP